MTILYNCHTDGTEYRITKFSDGEVESSYLCSFDECQCPAGSRPTCRHRLMLPMFIDRGAVNSFWFLDFERKGWVSNEPAFAQSWREAKVSEMDRKMGNDADSWASLAASTKPSSTPEEALEAMAKCPYWNGEKSLGEPEPPTKPSWRRL